MNRVSIPQEDNGLYHEIAGIGREKVDARNPSGLGMNDHLDEPFRPLHDDGFRHVLERQGAARADAIAFELPLLGEADAGKLRIGEDRIWHRVVVERAS